MFEQHQEKSGYGRENQYENKSMEKKLKSEKIRKKRLDRKKNTKRNIRKG